MVGPLPGPGTGAGARRPRSWTGCGPDRPTALGGRRLAEVRDLRDGGDLPPADAVIWDFDDRTRVVFRPSGTEPKLKIYLELIGQAQAGAAGYEAARAAAVGALGALRAELAHLLDLPAPDAGAGAALSP